MQRRSSGKGPPEVSPADRGSSEVLTLEARVALAEECAKSGHIDRALGHYQRARNEAAKQGQPRLAIRACGGMAAVYHHLGRVEQVVECYTEAVEAAQTLKDPHSEAGLRNRLGAACLLAGDFRGAIENHHSALRLFDKDDFTGVSVSLGGIGIAHYKLGEYPKAAEVYQSVVSLLDDEDAADLFPSLVGAHLALGGCSFKAAAYDAATSHVAHAVAVATSHKDDGLLLVASLSLGTLHLSKEQPEPALEYYRRALDFAEARGDARNQCRSLCGAGLCYYIGGELQGAAKLFQNALAKDSLVSSKGAITPTIGDQVVDEQLLAALHRWLRQHAPQGPTRAVMGTMYLGLTAVTMNGGGVLTPTSLPAGMVPTVLQALAVAATPEDDLSPTSLRYTPYLQHYCMHVVQQLVQQRALRGLMVDAAAVDAVLACLGFPLDALPVGGVRSHAAASKVIRSLVNSPPPRATREDVCDLLLRSPRLPPALEILPRRSRVTQPARAAQVVDILSAVAAILIPLTGPAASKGIGSPGKGTALSGASPPPIDAQFLLTAVCDVLRPILDAERPSDLDLAILEPCLRLVVQSCRRTVPLKLLVVRRLERPRIERLGNGWIPDTASASAFATELHRALRDYTDLRGRADEGTTTMDETTHDHEETTFDSLSSNSSLMYSGLGGRSISIHRLTTVPEGPDGAPDDLDDLP